MSEVGQAMRKLIAIIGPTATGKTELAIDLGRRYHGEIVGADSRQVYRYMDIGTAKPTPVQRDLAPHHLIDVVSPDEPFSLAQYQELAYQALEAIWGRGRVPLLVGGTGQYVWAILEGWNVPRLPPDWELRRSLEERALGAGPLALWQELAAVDPTAAARIHPQNVRRTVRALEVYHRWGQPISAVQTKAPLECDTLVIGLTCGRDELYRRIDQRVDGMIQTGLVDEVRGLLERGYHRELPALSGIGYKQIGQHLAGELTLGQATERIKTETHRLARRQHTWFKPKDERIRWFEADGEALPTAMGWVDQFLGQKAPEMARKI